MFVQGFYGEVYKGTLERLDCEAELVAVKKLRTDALSTTLADFEREINIMKVIPFHRFFFHILQSY